ncbi:hypothetical protein SAMN05444162_3780 [Paenibacillaceae bacterium GAS479]|nr:hypothetical protein SAMN05444162_3780 [Paenibacillaceae bacterium GAS479]
MRMGRKESKLSGASSRLLLADRREALLLDDLEEDLEFAEDWACSGPMLRKERGENEGE